jgi:tRNA dimethylallyltransferase
MYKAKGKYDLITILGPTASGKTQLAANIAHTINSEIISADSRQVYRGMNLGTGKDYDDYIIDWIKVPYHLIDIVDAGYKYNVFEYQADFLKVYKDILGKRKIPIFCGGSGLYIESVIKGYKLVPVPENAELRNKLSCESDEVLIKLLASYKKLHNQTDIDTRKRMIRAIEIEEYYSFNKVEASPFPEIRSIVFGVKYDRGTEKKRITERLKQRLDAGMVEEVKDLMDSGIKPHDIIYYGLEYKFITHFLLGDITYNEMFNGLNIAIRQFAKRQMTWFRKMERDGLKIHWIEGNIPLSQKLDVVLQML